MTGSARAAVALVSGGLDSALAAKLVADQGVKVFGLHLTNVFNSNYSGGALPEDVRQVGAEIGVELAVEDISQELIALVKLPPHGRGANMNPCIDCRIMCFRRAWRYAPTVGAGFLVTGEVLNQRPMSQRRDAMTLIEDEGGVTGRVLRPLSATLLPESEPERLGWVDRSKLLGLRGRGRKAQIAMAKELGISSYLTPAGGCGLTDPGTAAQVRDLLDHGDLTPGNVLLARAGRPFRAPGGEIIAIGRDETGNKRLLALAVAGDEVFSAERSSPLTVLRPGGRVEARELAAKLTARYCKGRGLESVAVFRGQAGWDAEDVSAASPMRAAPADDELVRLSRIGGA